jgi:hypothetical protein
MRSPRTHKIPSPPRTLTRSFWDDRRNHADRATAGGVSSLVAECPRAASCQPDTSGAPSTDLRDLRNPEDLLGIDRFAR